MGVKRMLRILKKKFKLGLLSLSRSLFLQVSNWIYMFGGSETTIPDVSHTLAAILWENHLYEIGKHKIVINTISDDRQKERTCVTWHTVVEFDAWVLTQVRCKLVSAFLLHSANVDARISLQAKTPQ